MSNPELKKLKEKIYSRIHEMEDETALQMLNEAVEEYKITSKKDILDALTHEEWQRLQESIRQADQGKLIPNDEVKRKTREWLSK
jgi:enolase